MQFVAAEIWNGGRSNLYFSSSDIFSVMRVKMLFDLEFMALNLHTCQLVMRRMCADPSVLHTGLVVCLVRLMWHGGHFCQIPYPGPCCDVKGTVKRQPRGSAGTAALGAPFPLWQSHIHTQMRIQANTSMFSVK